MSDVDAKFDDGALVCRTCGLSPGAFVHTDSVTNAHPFVPRELATTNNTRDEYPSMIAGQLHAMQRDMSARLDSIDQTLKLFARIELKLDVIVDRQNVADRRLDNHERRLTALEATKAKRRTTAARKKK